MILGRVVEGVVECRWRVMVKYGAFWNMGIWQFGAIGLRG